MSSVIAVVPTFRPDSTVVARLTALSAQVEAVIVVDDGSPDDAAPVLGQLRSSGLEVVLGGQNRGIAAALNAGIRIALDRGATHVLTIDQDSTLPPDYVARCMSAFAISPPSSRVGIVCAESIGDAPTIAGGRTPEGFGILRVAIQSGFVISARCLRDCGLFDERLFIDYVDTEYCLRIAARGYRVVAAPGTRIEHALGEKMPLRRFGVPVRRDGVEVTYEYHSPVRRYFITRNSIDLYFRYLRTMPRWVASSVRQELRPFADTMSSGPHRGRHLLATLVGAAHGLVRHRGPIAPGLRRALTPR